MLRNHYSNVTQEVGKEFVITTSELSEKVKRVWSPIGAVSSEDIEHLGWDDGTVGLFLGVKPVDVDIESSEFDVADEVLFELPSRAAAAYLGTYLISLLNGLDFQEKGEFPMDVLTRAQTITVLTMPTFWTDIAAPNLPPDCLEVIGDVAELLASKRFLLPLEDSQVSELQRLIRSVNRNVWKRQRGGVK